MSHTRHEQGFTLVEVLVALAIVAVALGAGVQAAGALANNTQRMIDVSAAQWCADNELVNMKLSRQFPSVGDTEFNCQQLGREFKGQLQVRPTPNPNFRRVDAQMSDAAGQPLLRLSTVLGRY
jgi:general secretion pathway protein I